MREYRIEPPVWIQSETGFAAMRASELVLPHMRGAGIAVGNKVHTLFRFSKRPSDMERRGGPA